MSIRHSAAASLIALAIAAASPLHAEAPPAAAAEAAAEDWGKTGLQTQWVEPAIKPGDDFHTYVNGKWLATVEIPADRTRYGAFQALDERSQDQVSAILAGLATGKSAPGSAGARVAAAYDAFMDTDAIERAGLSPLYPQLDRIYAARTVDDLGRLFAEPGISSPIGMDVRVDARSSREHVLAITQAPLGLPDRDYYLVDSPRNRQIQAKYREYLAFLFRELGYGDPQGTADAVFGLETRMARANWDRATNRNRDLTYNRLTIDELVALAPGAPIRAMLDAAGAGNTASLMVAQLPPTAEEFKAAGIAPEAAAKLGGGVPAIARMITPGSTSLWQAWLAKNLVSGNAAVLPRRIDEASFAFFGKFLGGQPEQRPRWKRAIDAVEDQVGELLGQIYVERYFPPQNKVAMEKLVGNLRSAMAANLSDLKWMGPQTRQAAKAKLDAFTPKIGYPDKFKTYDGLELRPDAAFANNLAAARWQWQDQVRRLGQPVDRSEWSMLPQTVNASYSSVLNHIQFPAAILQPPFFNISADDAVNYGGIGAVIGHEMGHGFDDQGAKSDGDGNLRDWWTASDKAAFTALGNALAAQYDGYCPFDEGKTCINGRLTLGENIGDLGGLSLAYRAYHLSLGGKEAPVIDGLTGDQRFFMSWAQVWRGKSREATARQLLLTDPHSPANMRANGIVRNFDEWYRAFNVQPGDKLYLPPEKRLRIW